MTSDGARRDAVRRRPASGREEEREGKADVRGSVEAHDGDAIALLASLFLEPGGSAAAY
jgi:hypothetical protein